MADKVQFNPSTGKVNVKDESHAPASTAFALGAGMGGIGGGAAGLPSTGTFVPIGAAAFAGVAMPFDPTALVKVQMVRPPIPGDDCAHCEAGETPLYLTVTITGLLDCSCYYDSFNDRYLKAENIASAINGNSYLIEQSDGSNCWWLKDGGFIGDYGDLYFYRNPDCTDLTSQIEFNRLMVKVVREADAVLLEAYVYIHGVGQFSYAVNQSTGIYTKCAQATIVDGSVCEAYSGTSRKVCYDGTAVIEEGDKT